MLTTYVKVSNWISDKAEEDKGEMASWLVLAAGLAAIAATLQGTLQGIMDGLAAKIGA